MLLEFRDFRLFVCLVSAIRYFAMKAPFYSILAACLTISSCVTPYQPLGGLGGYSETMLAPDVARITFKGNNATAPERVQDMALLRASELCLQAGYKKFVILDEANNTDTAVINTPGHSYTNVSAYAIGGTVNAYGNTTYLPGQSIPIRTSTSGLMVKFVRQSPSGLNAFDAQFLQTSLRQKYKL